MDIGSDATGVKRSLAVTLGLMAGITAAIVGLAVIERPRHLLATGASAARGAPPAETAMGHAGAKAPTVYGGFGGTGRSFGSVASG